jgi:biopolymer transport protein ExbD
MASGGGSTESGEPEFQIAPMIDVLLVLLIFFMSITSAEVLKVDKDIVLPVSPNAAKRNPELTKHELAVNVAWPKGPDKKPLPSGRSIIKVDDVDYTTDLAKLIGVLQAKKLKDPQLRVVVRGDKAVPAIDVQRVMNVVGEGGIADISFAASNKD